MDVDHPWAPLPYTGRLGSIHDAFRDRPPSRAPLYERAVNAYETRTLVASQMPPWVPQFHTTRSGYTDLEQDSVPSCSLPSIQDSLSSLTTSNFASLGWAHHVGDMDVCHPSPSAPEIVAPAPRSPSPNPSIISTTCFYDPDVDPDVLLCLKEGCAANFSGTYRRGNLQRHMRLKHGAEERTYQCEAKNCRRIFKRQDARLKHYRKQHRWLLRPPAAMS
jgi:hypothetical protein